MTTCWSRSRIVGASVGGILLGVVVLYALVSAQVSSRPAPGVPVAPVTIRATDGSIQYLIDSTLGATDYVTFTAGQAGVGPTSTVTSSETNVPLNWTAKGTGRLNFLNGAFGTPILALGGDPAGLLAHPTGFRFANASAAVSFGFAVPTNGSFALRPATGGNYNSAGLGTNSVDIQLCAPTNTAHIASGASSFTAGCGSQASGSTSVALGSFATASAGNTFAVGTSSNASNNNSTVLGQQGASNGAQGSFNWSSGQISAAGDTVWSLHILKANIAASSTTATRLTQDLAAAGANNSMPLNADNTSYRAECMASAQAVGSEKVATWTVSGILTRGTGAASTSWTSTAGTVATETIGVGSALTFTAAADTTNAALNLTFTDTNAVDTGGWHVAAACRTLRLK